MVLTAKELMTPIFEKIDIGKVEKLLLMQI
jgi:hypothetical protein